MSQFQKWVAGIPLSIPPLVDSFPIKDNLAITKGQVVVQDAGLIVVATNMNSANRKCFVAIADCDNLGGAAAAKGVSLVGGKQRVTVQTKSILKPGDKVKVSATAGMVEAFDPAMDDSNLAIGVYIGKEPGVYSKDSMSPYAEQFSTDSDPEVNAAVDDIVAIELLE